MQPAVESHHVTQQRSNRGITLIELMVVVAVIGVLASIAVVSFTRSQHKARTTEVAAVFAEFAAKQERYHIENARYLSTGADETDAFPAPTQNNPADAVASRPGPWDELRINLSQSALYCDYVFIADLAEQDPVDTIGLDIIGAGPTRNWWYGIARCPFNGRTYVTTFEENKPYEYE